MRNPTGYDLIDKTPYVDVHRERQAAHEKHKDKPGGSMEMKDFDDPAWTDVLVEEVGEVSHEINDYRHGLLRDHEFVRNLRKELVQVAAMACAWIAAIDEHEEGT